MALNLVTVNVTAQASPVDAVPPEGNYVFIPNGTEWPGTPGSLPIIPQIQQGTLVSGTGSVQLVATDNFSTGVLDWDIVINIRGLETINVPGCVVNYATGATQSVWDILNAAGWVPVSQP